MIESLETARDYTAPSVPGIEREGVIPAALAGGRLDVAAARLFPEYSRSRLKSWIDAGALRVDGAARAARDKVWEGETLRLATAPHPADLPAQAQAIALQVVHEDAALLVIDKPAGLVVHPGHGNWDGTLMNALLHHTPELAHIPRAGIVHRLDKDTSGLLVVAKTLTAQTDLVRQLAARTVRREYLALVHGEVARDGQVDAPIGRDPVHRTRMAVVSNGKPALTRYRVLERFFLPPPQAGEGRGGGKASLLECALATGRTHQIRVHMTHLGHPLVGDPVYRPRGSVPSAPCGFARQALHARRLGLVHPQSGIAMQWEAPLPEDFHALLEALRRAAG
jgi:23S rRNA pseudouridine1911/1915/1917 synthase